MVTFATIVPQLIGAPGLAKTSDWFRWRLFNGAIERQLKPDCLASVISFESAGSYSPTIQNPQSGAFGLIQFMPNLVQKVFGKSAAEMKAMSAEEQLELVLEYYGRKSFAADVRGSNDCGQFYLVVFMPAALSKPDTYPLGVKDSPALAFPGQSELTQGKIYEQNSGFDTAKVGAFTAGDVRNFMRAKVEAWQKNTPVPVPTTKPSDPRSMSSSPRSTMGVWLLGAFVAGVAIVGARVAQGGRLTNPRLPRGATLRREGSTWVLRFREGGSREFPTKEEALDYVGGLAPNPEEFLP